MRLVTDSDITAEAIRAQTENLLVELFPAGVQVAGEFCIGDLTGNPGRSLKFNLRTHRWCDFANPEHKGGDIISLWAAAHSIDRREAFRELAERIGRPFEPKTLKKAKNMKKNDGKLGWISTVAPWRTALPDFCHPKLGRPSKIYSYYGPEGRYGWVCRYETPEGKEIRPISFAYDPLGENRHEWRWQHMAEPRPLYNLLRLTETPCTFAIVVEGEKAADALGEVVWPVTTWSGGGPSWSKTDWTPLKGKRVILWPDNDKPGFDCMEAIQKHLNALGIETFLLETGDLPPKADAADLSDPLGYLVLRLPVGYVREMEDSFLGMEAS